MTALGRSRLRVAVIGRRSKEELQFSRLYFGARLWIYNEYTSQSPASVSRNTQVCDAWREYQQHGKSMCSLRNPISILGSFDVTVICLGGCDVWIHVCIFFKREMLWKALPSKLTRTASCVWECSIILRCPKEVCLVFFCLGAPVLFHSNIFKASFC